MYITPCVSVCQVDAFTGVCIGCGRTQKQINHWNDYTDDQRMEVMKSLGYGKRMSKEERLRRYDRG